jgi:hypothetical protein
MRPKGNFILQLIVAQQFINVNTFYPRFSVAFYHRWRRGEACPQGTVAPTGQHLFRHGLRRATFPKGEGFAATEIPFSSVFSHSA